MKTGRTITLWAVNPRPYDDLLEACQNLKSRYPHRVVTLQALNRMPGGLVTACVKIQSK